MKRIVLLTCVLAVATLASAQLYKYVDKNGKTVYTDQPPPEADPKAMRIPSSAVGSSQPPAKTAVQQDKDLQKGACGRRALPEREGCLHPLRDRRAHLDGQRAGRAGDAGRRRDRGRARSREGEDG